MDPDVVRDALAQRSMFNVIDMKTAFKVDFVIRKDRPFSIIAKLEWAKQGGSERQLTDVAGILQVRRAELDLAYIERWIRELELEDQWARAIALSA